MEEGMLWRADVMEGPCAVARGKDISTSALRDTPGGGMKCYMLS